MNGKTAKLLRKVADKVPSEKSTKNLYRNMKSNWNKLNAEGRKFARRSFKRFLEEAQ